MSSVFHIVFDAVFIVYNVVIFKFVFIHVLLLSLFGRHHQNHYRHWWTIRNIHVVIKDLKLKDLWSEDKVALRPEDKYKDLWSEDKVALRPEDKYKDL